MLPCSCIFLNFILYSHNHVSYYHYRLSHQEISVVLDKVCVGGVLCVQIMSKKLRDSQNTYGHHLIIDTHGVYQTFKSNDSS